MTHQHITFRQFEDYAARSGFAHELNPDQAERVLFDGAVRQLIRHFSFLFDPELFEFIRGGHRVRRSGIYQKK